MRLLTPGIYGNVGLTKWLTELEVTTFADFDQYWVRRGYAEQAPVKQMTRIDTPRSGERLTPGAVSVAGVAWAQADRGIDGVEVRVDDGSFEPAELAAGLGEDPWRQWCFERDATPGRHTIVARALDGTGQTQTEEAPTCSPTAPPAGCRSSCWWTSHDRPSEADASCRPNLRLVTDPPPLWPIRTTATNRTAASPA